MYILFVFNLIFNGLVFSLKICICSELTIESMVNNKYLDFFVCVQIKVDKTGVSWMCAHCFQFNIVVTHNLVTVYVEWVASYVCMCLHSVRSKKWQKSYRVGNNNLECSFVLHPTEIKTATKWQMSLNSNDIDGIWHWNKTGNTRKRERMK